MMRDRELAMGRVGIVNVLNLSAAHKVVAPCAKHQHGSQHSHSAGDEVWQQHVKVYASKEEHEGVLTISWEACTGERRVSMAGKVIARAWSNRQRDC